MIRELPVGIQTNGIKHSHQDPMPSIDTRFAMVRESGVFDYVDKTPDPVEIDAFEKASEKYGIPVRCGGWYYVLGRDEPLLSRNLETGKRLGSLDHNVQILSHGQDGELVTNQEVVRFYERALEQGQRLGVRPCLEVHCNMWSEDFRRVEQVGQLVEARGLPYRLTLDHSHVIFKIDNPEEQAVFDIRPDVLSGALVLDPFAKGSICKRWIDAGWVGHCHARSTVPDNPKNFDALDGNGNYGRGIQYPFAAPSPGAYHSAWDEERLEPWKEVVRQLLHYHAVQLNSPLGQISTEFIPNLDYGEGCRYSLFEQGIACASWIREACQGIDQDHR
ncbi:MAG: hypothetical protein VX249_05975 [Pseudomonadota bacterium]|nr:hypothetical protein [Pseudomonadota bacterium]